MTLPRLGSRVRIPSPAPISFKISEAYNWLGKQPFSLLWASHHLATTAAEASAGVFHRFRPGSGLGRNDEFDDRRCQQGEISKALPNVRQVPQSRLRSGYSRIRFPDVSPDDLGGKARGLPEIPCLHLDRIDVEIRNGDTVRFQALWRQAARIKVGVAMVHFITAPMRQGEGGIAATDTCQRVR
jgi:hypothetical protein